MKWSSAETIARIGDELIPTNDEGFKMFFEWDNLMAVVQENAVELIIADNIQDPSWTAKFSDGSRLYVGNPRQRVFSGFAYVVE